jgi:hypothetical protein
MLGLTIEEAQEHIEVLKSKMEEEINYYKTEIQLALQDAAHDKKWEDYQKYLNEWEQNAEEAENERQIRFGQSYGPDSNYDFWENYDEREDYNSKSEEEASENSCEEDDLEDDDAEEEERVDNGITYQLLQSMFDYKNAEPEDCCISKSNEEEIWLLKEQVEMLRQQVSKLEETNTLLIRVIKEQIGLNF